MLTGLRLLLCSNCCPICSGEASAAYRRSNKEFVKSEIETELHSPYEYEFNPCYDDYWGNPDYMDCCSLVGEADYCYGGFLEDVIRTHPYECDYSDEPYDENCDENCDGDSDEYYNVYGDSLGDSNFTEDSSSSDWTEEEIEEYYRTWPTPHEAAQRVLREVLDIAINRLEMDETEKLVREYDLIGYSGDEDVGGRFTDDEYEVVDYVLA
jgi:hypothetical protein